MTVHEYVTGPNSCSTCRHSAPVPLSGWGVCRKRAPVANPALADTFRGWPMVAVDDLCGEFTRDLRPVLETTGE